MARRTPRVTRPKSLTTLETPSTREAPVRGSVDGTSTKLGRSLEEEYSHIRGDLMRILILAGLILVGMVVLRLVIGA